MLTTVRNHGAVALSHARAIAYNLLAYAAWLLATYERLLGALAGALIGSVEGLVKAVRSPALKSPLAAGAVMPAAAPNGILAQPAVHSVKEPTPAAKASPAKPTARPAAVTVTPLAAPLTPAKEVAFAEPVSTPAEAQQEPGTPRPAARVSGKVGGDDASSTAPPSPAPSTVPPPPTHPSPATARLLSFPVVVDSSPSSVATTKAEEEEEEVEDVKASTEVPQLTATPVKAAVPEVTAVAASPSSPVRAPLAAVKAAAGALAECFTVAVPIIRHQLRSLPAFSTGF
jgi:hypothetical protein